MQGSDVEWLIIILMVLSSVIYLLKKLVFKRSSACDGCRGCDHRIKDKTRGKS